MKKLFQVILLAAVLCCGFSAQASAQEFGIKGSVNIADKSPDALKNFVGYNAGLTVQFPLPLWFSIQPDILFHVKGDYIRNEKLAALGMGYLEIPVNVQWGPSFLDGRIRVFGQVSPYVGYAISKDLQDAQGNKYGWTDINRFEYGLGAGIGLRLWCFQIVGQYDWGFGGLARFGKDNPLNLINDKNFNGYTISLNILF